ncbi:MAG: D-alanyl-D-alanine dipeptidase [Proteobacteria bacterium]|nr:D-alanyl-D-alanine dipeptidase [Pseudomonadota bacterium]
MTNIRYQSIPIVENSDPMVEVARAGLIAEPMYFKSGTAKSPHLFMREGLARLLKDIEAQALKTHGLRFKIWDAWRPRDVQHAIYTDYSNRLKRENPGWDEARLAREVGLYVTPADDPQRIPPHATGGSVDLTLCDAEGNDLPMGTGFDHFGVEAHLRYFEEAGRDARIRDNRRLLFTAMKDAGFSLDNEEWWHYDFGNQKWAMALGQPKAFYGEVSDCALDRAGKISFRLLQA